jgi:sugar diacid utilization regulator
MLSLAKRMLAGEPVDTSQFNYDFDGFHIGLVASGPDTAGAIKEVAKSLDCISMVLEISDASTWAWLGRRRVPDINHVQKLVSEHWPALSFLAIGEIGKGRAGWRLTHHQARDGLPVSLQKADRFFRYGDDPFLPALLQDNVLAQSLRQMYLIPLFEGSDGGHKLLQTLRAYSAAERNSASAAKALRISRQTVKNHLQAVEGRVGHSLSSCMAELEAALRLDTLDRLGQWSSTLSVLGER